ncbi:MAG TPA: hypothetical protein VMY77_17765 [Chitinophagaceae bacterium]|nr:hypothetical protein [Chitinophagaceae bacterium]
MIDNNTYNYENFLKKLIANNYRSYFFNEIHKQAENGVVLRHDIDFDCTLAYQMAVLESQLKLKSTYFFLISSESYNIASKSNYDNIQRIKELGHSISIHFDPLAYNDFKKALKSELNYFQDLFDVEVDIISIHRPNKFFLESDKPINGIEHTYQSKYFRDIKYFADSTGEWRFGHPFDSVEFKEKKNLHILIHPVWWMLTEDEISTDEKMKLYYKTRIIQLKNHFLNNCSPFSKVYDQV